MTGYTFKRRPSGSTTLADEQAANDTAIKTLETRSLQLRSELGDIASELRARRARRKRLAAAFDKAIGDEINDADYDDASDGDAMM